MMTTTHKSKNKEEIILKAKILGCLASYLAEACLLYHRDCWQCPTKLIKGSKISSSLTERRLISKVLTTKIMLICVVNFNG